MACTNLLEPRRNHRWTQMNTDRNFSVCVRPICVYLCSSVVSTVRRLAAIALLAFTPHTAAAVDLAGRWLVEVDGFPAHVVELTQTADTVTIPVAFGTATGGHIRGPIRSVG